MRHDDAPGPPARSNRRVSTAPRHAELRVGRSYNDNALVESKNASVVRKYIGHGHIPRRFAPLVNEFTRNTLSPFLNSHRPCLFPTHTLDAKGRVRRRYRLRAEDRAGLVQALRSLQHLPSIHSLPNSAYDSFHRSPFQAHLRIGKDFPCPDRAS